VYVCERGRQQQWLLYPTTAIAVRTCRGNVEGACLVRGIMTGACGYPKCAYKCKLALRGEGDVVSELFHTQGASASPSRLPRHLRSLRKATTRHLRHLSQWVSQQQMLYGSINTEIPLLLHQIPILMVLEINTLMLPNSPCHDE
jgi:hypothetical protein